VRPPSVATAARNNAAWCDLMCRAHGSGGTFDAHTWSTPIRSPRYYPDAVTLDAEANVDDLLTRVDTAAGCSIKDSFATLDLAPAGFRVLFDADWIFRPPAPASSPGGSRAWTRVTDRRELGEWESAWAVPGDTTTLSRGAILDDPNVFVLAGRAAGEIAEGAMLYRAAHVVGVSNVFTRDRDLDAVWNAVVRAASVHCPGEAIVGYESGADLAAARLRGCVALGPLRVWVND
jgi:hypothetical protein